MNKPNADIYWTSDYRLRVVDMNEINENLISAWADLESRAVEANCFLSPYFVLPALKYLEARCKVLILLVEKISPGNNLLVGVGVFKVSKPSKYFPLPHLTGFKTKYSYLSGLLVDRDYADHVIRLIYKFLVQPTSKWHSLIYHAHKADGILRELEKNVMAEFGMQWVPFREWERANIFINRTEDDPKKNLTKKIHQNITRRMQRLDELGNVEWNVRMGEHLTLEVMERFMTLENMGWKKKQGTSIYSKESDALFFQEISENFNRAGRIFCNELSLNGTALASIVYIISGMVGFDFKIGWDPSYARFSPGNLLHSYPLYNIHAAYTSFDYIDSGSQENAMYLNVLWPSRQKMESGFYAITSSGKIVAPFMSLAARVKNQVENKIAHKVKRVHVGSESK